MPQSEFDSKATSCPHCSLLIFTLNPDIGSSALFAKVSQLFPCGSKAFLNIRASSTRLLINQLVIQPCKSISHLANTTFVLNNFHQCSHFPLYMLSYFKFYYSLGDIQFCRKKILTAFQQEKYIIYASECDVCSGTRFMRMKL